jgi:hypothetical protein
MSIFDAHGAPIWWMHASSYGPWDGKLLENGNLVWTRSLNTHFGVLPQEAWEERRLDGGLVRELSTVGSPTDIHDLQRLPNGNYLLDTYRLRSNVDMSAVGGPRKARVYDGEIQELTPSGRRVWSWNSKDHIELSEAKRWYPDIFKAAGRMSPAERSYDVVHLNSVEPDGDGYIVSARFLDAVFRIDKRSGAVTWKLGGTHTSESLAVKNDSHPLLPFDGQHDARLYRDRTLTVYDNGTRSGRAPRALRYRIDTRKRTATMLEEIRSSDVPRSGWGGSARKLPSGNWVVYWGGTTRMTEQTPSGDQALAILFDGDRYSYRAFPIQRGQLSAQALRQGMNRILRDDRSEIAR